MGIRSLFVALSLAQHVLAWPQLPFDEDDFGGEITLPVIPFQPRSLPAVDDFDSVATLPVELSGRSLPVLDDLDSVATLPVELSGRSLPVDDDATGVLTLPVLHAAKPGLVGRGIEMQLENRSDVAYYALLAIGTPPQNVYAQLDTGSFELWVNPDCTSLKSASDQRFCSAVGKYDVKRSSSATDTDTQRTLKYGIGAADVDYIEDDISLPGSKKIKQLRFGVASSSEDQFAGILGMGYGKGRTTSYMNFMDQMADQSVIKTKAFSLALGSKAEGEGTLIFGGVDKSKFAGDLVGLPIIPGDDAPDGVARYWVSMESITHTKPNGKSKTFSDSKRPVFLDSGATLTLLPPDLVQDIASDFGSTKKDANGFHIVDCDLLGREGTVDFKFKGVTIKVPYHEIIREIKTSPPYCYLGIVPSTDFALLGDTFLRSAYVVFDLEGDTAYLAPYVNCGSNVSKIQRSSDIKGMSGACSLSDDSDDETRNPSNGGSDKSTSTFTSVAPTRTTGGGGNDDAEDAPDGLPTDIPDDAQSNRGPSRGGSSESETEEGNGQDDEDEEENEDSGVSKVGCGAETAALVGAVVAMLAMF